MSRNDYIADFVLIITFLVYYIALFSLFDFKLTDPILPRIAYLIILSIPIITFPLLIIENHLNLSKKISRKFNKRKFVDENK